MFSKKKSVDKLKHFNILHVFLKITDDPSLKVH